MKVTNVKRIELETAIPVYDATSPKHHNYVLANGCVVHNTAKLARDKSFQATFALKGKPLNVMETTKDKVNANKEIASLFAGIGLELGHKDPLSKLRFGKIIFLTDPDVDGRHINTLLFALLWKYLPDLFKMGRIYVVRSPEYLCKYRGKTFFGENKEDIYAQTGSEKVDIRHIKGWGEIEPEDMQPIAFDLKQRRLYRVTAPNSKEGRKNFVALMGKDPSFRKKLLGVVE